jgi:methylisocitrate lyase
MQTRAELYDLVDYPGYGAFDTGVYDFSLEGNRA